MPRWCTRRRRDDRTALRSWSNTPSGARHRFLSSGREQRHALVVDEAPAVAVLVTGPLHHEHEVAHVAPHEVVAMEDVVAVPLVHADLVGLRAPLSGRPL